MKLALTGAIKDQLLHLDDLTIYGLDFFARYYPGQIKARYPFAEESLLVAGGMDLTKDSCLEKIMNGLVSGLFTIFVKEN